MPLARWLLPDGPVMDVMVPRWLLCWFASVPVARPPQRGARLSSDLAAAAKKKARHDAATITHEVPGRTGSPRTARRSPPRMPAYAAGTARHMSTNKRLVDATPDQVWSVLADGWLYPLWVVGASRMREVDDEWPEPGARLHHSVGTWPLLIDDT